MISKFVSAETGFLVLDNVRFELEYILMPRVMQIETMEWI